jgi:thiol-disulfide isomerase/thioredoxin
MLKKLVTGLAYLLVMLSLGFAIFHYFLNPANSDSTSSDYAQLSTEAFFAAKLPDENGISQALSQYQGKIIVLNFWATWCPPCREEMPELSALHDAYKDKNVVVLGVAIDEIGLVKEFTQATPVSYPLFAAEDEGMALGSDLGNNKSVLPYTLIIGNDGKVVKTFFGRINKSLLEATLATLSP